MPDNEYMRMARELPRSRFVQQFTHPFIVFGELRGDASSVEFKTRAAGMKSWAAMLEEQRRQEDERVRRSTMAPAAPELEEEAEGAVLPVVKSDRNPYSDRISVGRSRTNDIVLASAHVSKLHAHVLPNLDGTFDLRDAGSSNGTFRNGARLNPNERVRLRPGDKLRFGWLETQLLDSAGLYDWLKSH